MSFCLTGTCKRANVHHVHANNSNISRFEKERERELEHPRFIQSTMRHKSILC